MKKTFLIALSLALLAPSSPAASNINASSAYGWGANFGWTNWRPSAADGVSIGEYILSGYIYGANVGWINVGKGSPLNHIHYQNNSSGDFGVNFITDPATPAEAKLRGFAYGANIGWINFEDKGNPRIVLATRRLKGFAYSANLGWINLDDPNFFVKSDSIAPGADTDADGIADAFEYQYFGGTDADPDADSDTDGTTNKQEYTDKTDPLFPDLRLVNISTRMRVLIGERVLIAGFIVTGTQQKKIMIRGIGPSLANFGIQGTLGNPTLELRAADTTLLFSNNNWKQAPNAQAIQDSGLAPSHDFESAILQTLAPGTYTAILRGVSNTTGIAVVEAYDLNEAVASKLANISTRGIVDTDDNVMIAGLIIKGKGNGKPRVVVRARGPSLTQFGIAGALVDPLLELRNTNGTLLAGNDNWKLSAQKAEIEATGFAPSDDREPAVVRALTPGNYTAIIRGKGNTTGVSLVEVYNIP
jgi:hypothetical protein